MSSSTRLLVLGVVRIFQPVHGYDVRRELLSWRAEEWANVSPGSVYNALKSLTRDRLLEIVGIDQVGGRPERTTYRLTAEGESEFQSLLRQTWWTLQVPIDPLMPALSFLPAMRREEVVAALEHRVAQIKGAMKQHEYRLAAHRDEAMPEHVLEMFALQAARVESEVAWATAFIAKLEAGEYPTIGAVSGVARGARSPSPSAPRPRRPKSAKTKPKPKFPRKKSI